MSGIVFDIKRFSLHDGPGIRTTVFLKGCYLRCQWCCNPESQKSNPEILFINAKCTLCGKCEDVCPVNAHQTGNNIHTLDFALCTGCGQCVDACLYDAVKMAGKGMEDDEVMKLVELDRKYYENSGGGITLSGGDPLYQFSFSLALLKKAKDAGIHTCLETSGFAKKNILEQLVPHVDLFLHDFKHHDPEMHRKYTGAGNELIIESLEFLCQSNAAVILRCPIIPGINDNNAHFRQITALSKRYENIEGVEIMPYHDFGKAKYEQTGREYMISAKPPSFKETEAWIEQLQAMGCSNLRKG